MSGDVKELIGGYRIDREDRPWLESNQMADHVLMAANEIPFQIPDIVDPSKITVIRNQGQEGSCDGHAGTGASGMVYYGRTGAWKRFSADEAYYITQQIDGIHGDNGATIAGMMKFLCTIGPIPEENMPYSDRYNPQDVPKNYKELGTPYICATHRLLKTYDDVVNWIGKGYGGVLWGTVWGVSLDANNFARFDGRARAGHARHISGYDLTKRQLTEDNSWSVSYGDHGRLHWTEAEFTKAALHPYTVIAGVTDMNALKPRKIDFTKTLVMG